MNGYRFDVTCPSCGADVVECAPGAKPSGAATRVSAIVKCSECRSEWQVVVVMTSVRESPRRFSSVRDTEMRVVELSTRR